MTKVEKLEIARALLDVIDELNDVDLYNVSEMQTALVQASRHLIRIGKTIIEEAIKTP